MSGEHRPRRAAAVTAPRPRERHLSFRRLSEILPPAGTREARSLSHLLLCERCADAALTVLQAPAERPAQGSYDVGFERAAAKVAQTHEWLLERRRQAEALAAELALLSPRDQVEKVLTLSRLQPWEVAGALLDHGRQVVARSPGLAKHLAGLAELALTAIPPEDDGARLAQLSLERACLLADAAIHLGELGAAEAALTAAVAQLFSRSRPQDRAFFCLTLAGLRRAQGRLDEDLALLQRAADLYQRAEDDVGAGEALAMAEEVEALLRTESAPADRQPRGSRRQARAR